MENNTNNDKESIISHGLKHHADWVRVLAGEAQKYEEARPRFEQLLFELNYIKSHCSKAIEKIMFLEAELHYLKHRASNEELRHDEMCHREPMKNLGEFNLD